MIALVSWAQTSAPLDPGGLEWWRALLGLVLVAALMAALVILVRKGALGTLVRSKNAAVRIDAVVPLGERRTLMIVSVEGRRLLLGSTPVNVSLVAELGPAPAFDATLARTVAGAQGPPR